MLLLFLRVSGLYGALHEPLQGIIGSLGAPPRPPVSGGVCSSLRKAGVGVRRFPWRFAGTWGLVGLGFVACGRASKDPASGMVMGHFSTIAARDEADSRPWALPLGAGSDDLPLTRFPTPTPTDWVELTEEEITRELKTDQAESGYLPPEAPETLRAQGVLDALFDALQATDPSRFVASDGGFRIPRPIVRVARRDEVNAGVMQLPVCYSMRVLFPEPSHGGNPVPSTHSLQGSGSIISIDSLGRVGVFSPGEVSCLDRRKAHHSSKDIAHALREKVPLEKCSWEEEADQLKLGGNCHFAAGPTVHSADAVTMRTVSNLLTITTGALRLFERDQDLSFTFAHELGHYLYAHGGLSKKGYVYFYRQTMENHRLAKPRPDPQLNELGQRLTKMPAYRTQPLAGQKIHSELFPYVRSAMTNLIEPTCSDEAAACHRPCEGLQRLKSTSHNFADFGRFPQSTLEPSMRVLYDLYETEFLNCTAAIPLLEDHQTVRPGHLALREAIRLYWNADPQGKKTLAALVHAMNERSWTDDHEKTSLLQAALDQKIGYFTTEEEADNLALEWSLAQEAKPEDIIDYWLKYSHAMRGKEQDSPLSYAFDRCADFFRQHGSKIKDGDDALVPIGSFADPHHSLCYRGYRMVQKLYYRYGISLSSDAIQDLLSQLP